MYRIGIDLGGTNIAVGLVTEDGHLVKKISTPTNTQDSAEAITEKMAKTALKMLFDEKIDRSEIISIGIGMPGAVDSENGICILTANLPFENTDIRGIFKKYTDIPVKLNNDANCAALGEVICGIAKGCDYALAITLGTGVGGGIVMWKKIYEGFNGAGGELGHMITHKDGRLCGCGRKGCFETYASATALIRDTKEAAQKVPESKIWEICEGDIDKINGKTVFDAMKAGDTTAKNVVENYLDELALGLTNYINIFQPEILFLGGGVANQKEELLVPLRERIYKECYGSQFLPHTKIECAILGNDAGIIGAAML